MGLSRGKCQFSSLEIAYNCIFAGFGMHPKRWFLSRICPTVQNLQARLVIEPSPPPPPTPKPSRESIPGLLHPSDHGAQLQSHGMQCGLQQSRKLGVKSMHQSALCSTIPSQHSQPEELHSASFIYVMFFYSFLC